MQRIRSTVRRPSPATVIAVVALVLAAGGVSYAVIPSGEGVVSACLRGDKLRVIDADAGQTCRRNETMLRLAAVDGSGRVADADALDGKDSTDFLGAGGKAADSDLLDGEDSTDFLGANAKAADADLLDGRNSTDFLGANAKAADADLLDGQNSTDFLGANAKAADADLLDGLNSSAFLGANAKAADADNLDGRNSSSFQSALPHALVLANQDGVLESLSSGVGDANVTAGTDPSTGQRIHGLACFHGLGFTPKAIFGSPDEFGNAGNYGANRWSVVGAVDESPPQCPSGTQAWAQIHHPDVTGAFSQSFSVLFIP